MLPLKHVLFVNGPMARILPLCVPFYGCWEERLLGSNHTWTFENILVVDDEEAIRKSFPQCGVQRLHCTAVSNGARPVTKVSADPDFV